MFIQQTTPRPNYTRYRNFTGGKRSIYIFQMSNVDFKKWKTEKEFIDYLKKVIS